MKSTRKVQKAGLQNEPVAAEKYATVTDHPINLYPSGIVLSPWAPWLAVSPDRRVYDPQRNPPFGLLEIKCPQVSSVLQATCLSLENGISSLKHRHMYYTQIQAQLAITGLHWCDFFIWCENDYLRRKSNLIQISGRMSKTSWTYSFLNTFSDGTLCIFNKLITIC
jgi:hypothetical protein